RVRERHELCLRKFSRPKQNVRLSIGQSHPPTIDGPRADEKTARDQQNRFARTFYFAQGQTVQSVSRVDRQERRWFRIRKARAETSHRGKDRSSRGLYFKTRPSVLRVSEIGGWKSRFRIPGETGTSHRLGHVNRRTAPLTKPRLPKSEEADLALTRTQAELRSAGK